MQYQMQKPVIKLLFSRLQIYNIQLVTQSIFHQQDSMVLKTILKTLAISSQNSNESENPKASFQPDDKLSRF